MAAVGEPEVYRTFEDGYIVRAMRASEAKIVQKWYCGMGVVSPYDLDIALEVFPPGPGFYIGEYQGEVVASAIRVPWTKDIYYGSYYYVEKKFRSKGFGTRLRDEVAREHVGKSLLVIDAVKEVQERNASKFGYVGSFTTRRYVAESVQADYRAKYDGKLVEASEVPLQDLIDFDNKHFIVKNCSLRRKFLENWFRVPGGATQVCMDGDNKIVGYGSRRPCMDDQPHNHVVGPLYAETPEVARAILQQLCQDVAGDRVTYDMWVPNEACLRMMEDFGFKKEFDVLRMHLNGKLNEYKDTVYAVTSIDICGF